MPGVNRRPCGTSIASHNWLGIAGPSAFQTRRRIFWHSQIACLSRSPDPDCQLLPPVPCV